MREWIGTGDCRGRRGMVHGEGGGGSVGRVWFELGDHQGTVGASSSVTRRVLAESVYVIYYEVWAFLSWNINLKVKGSTNEIFNHLMRS